MSPSMQILLVEDDDELRETLCEVLEDLGCNVVPARNGAEALQCLQTSLKTGSMPKLVLLDLRMPVMDGWEFRAAQLANPSLASIPVALVSGAADGRAAAAELRIRHFLPKPLDMARLAQVVELLAE